MDDDDAILDTKGLSFWLDHIAFWWSTVWTCFVNNFEQNIESLDTHKWFSLSQAKSFYWLLSRLKQLIVLSVSIHSNKGVQATIINWTDIQAKETEKGVTCYMVQHRQNCNSDLSSLHDVSFRFIPMISDVFKTMKNRHNQFVSVSSWTPDVVTGHPVSICTFQYKHTSHVQPFLLSVFLHEMNYWSNDEHITQQKELGHHTWWDLCRTYTKVWKKKSQIIQPKTVALHGGFGRRMWKGKRRWKKEIQ